MHVLKGVPMRTTLDMPEQLINDALKITHCKTKTQVITLALQNLIRKEKVQGIKKYRGKLRLGIDLDVLRQR
jgi:Arc/MetJ family transcription regulator